MSSRFIVFLLIGGLAATVNVLARIFFRQFTSYDVSIVAAFFVALTLAFALNRRYVFKAVGGRVSGQYTRFLIVNLAALLQVWLVSVSLLRFFLPAIHWSWQSETVAHAVGVLSPVVTSFWLHKHFSFSSGKKS